MIRAILVSVVMLLAAPEDNVDPSDSESVEAAPRHTPRKIRKGSLLHEDQPIAPVPDLRSEFEARRDAEIEKHYTRIARLERLWDLATEMDDARLADRVDALRRQEKQRHGDVMRQTARAATRAEGL